jgi:hypothetical protein
MTKAESIFLNIAKYRNTFTSIAEEKLKIGVADLKDIAEEFSAYDPKKVNQIKADLIYFENRFIGFWFKKEMGWAEFLHERHGLLNIAVCSLVRLENVYRP